jgi:hypothetical protein
VGALSQQLRETSFCGVFVAGISFGDELDTIWIAATWAFRQVLYDLRADPSIDTDALDAFAQAEHTGFLAIDRLPRGLAVKLTSALERWCREIMSGQRSREVDRALPDEDTRDMYRDGIAQLASAIQAADKRKGDAQ